MKSKLLSEIAEAAKSLALPLLFLLAAMVIRYAVVLQPYLR